MKILVTGGAGFIGSVLVPLLLDAGFKVRVFDKLLYDVNGLLSCFLRKEFEFVKGDICNPVALKKASQDVDAVVHLAALVGYPICKRNEAEAVRVNVEGTTGVAEAVDLDIPIVFTSTGSCYGNVKGVCSESNSLEPLTLYGKTKKDAELIIQNRGNSIIYRFATGYGVSPRMRLDLMINDFCYKAVKERNLVVYEKYSRRTFIHVIDMARSLMFAVQKFGTMRDRIFNVGDEEMNLTKEDIAELIRNKADYYLHYADFGHDKDHRDYEVSYEKIHSVGFSTTVPLDVGVDQLIRLFQCFEIKPQYSNV